MVVSARGLRLCGIIGVIVFLQTCWNGECSGSSWAKTLKLIEPTARHVDVRAQKPREPFGRRCYLRINSATAIRSANASSVHCLSANVSKMSPFHVHQSSCSQSHALCPSAPSPNDNFISQMLLRKLNGLGYVSFRHQFSF